MTASIRDELEAIRAEQGGVFDVRAAEEIVRTRGNEFPALFQNLEWDAEKGAVEWRIVQIRRLISVHVVDYRGTRELVHIRAVGPGYRPLEDVSRMPDWREAMLREALDDLERFKNRYRLLNELVEVFAAADALKVRSKPSGEVA